MEYLILTIGVGLIVYLYLIYEKNKKKNQTPYTESLETKVHLFNYGMNGKDDVESITFKNLETIKHEGKVYPISFLLFPNERAKVRQKKFEKLRSLRDLSSFPRKIHNVDASIQETLHKSNIWAITGELKYVNTHIVFSGIALREENNDDDDDDKGWEGEFTPVQPELEEILV